MRMTDDRHNESARPAEPNAAAPRPVDSHQPAPAVAPQPARAWIDRVIRFCLEQKLVVAMLVLFAVFWGFVFAPFDWEGGAVTRRPVATDAIPDTGENQQIVFTEWPGRSPQDVYDQVTFPLSSALMGIKGVKTVRTTSMFGFSSIYIIFDESQDFYDTRSRILEKLASLPSNTLPEGVSPGLGPDATGMGQIFWYTLEGRDPSGRPVGGWDLDELRSIQDWQVRYALLAATDERGTKPIAEIASIGGFVREYQVDVDPDAMRAADVTLEDVFQAVEQSNLDVGARTLEVNRVEYILRGLGFIRDLDQLANTVVAVRDTVPIRIRDVATVQLGPALRTGALDKDGAEAVGGVAVVRYGENPLTAIQAVKDKIAQVEPALPTRVVADYAQTDRAALEAFAAAHGFEAFSDGGAELNQEPWLASLRALPQEDWPAGVTTSHVEIVPFYDRTGLIRETLGTLNDALSQQILVTIIVVIVMMVNLRSSLLISGLLPLAVLMSFIAMAVFGVDANIVALSGIAIAIGTMVDMGIVMAENILAHLRDADPAENRLEVVFRASSEVGSAVFTAVATTVVGFLPVFLMTGASGKLFRPLAYTKTFALIASLVVALTIIPPAAHLLLASRTPRRGRLAKYIALAGLAGVGLVLGLKLGWWAVAVVLALVAAYYVVNDFLPARIRRVSPYVANAAAVAVVGVILTREWLPLGPGRAFWQNLLFAGGLVGGLLALYYAFQRAYGPVLRFCLHHKALFLLVPLLLVLLGLLAWQGPAKLLGPMERADAEMFDSTQAQALLDAEWLRRQGERLVWTPDALAMGSSAFREVLQRSGVEHLDEAMADWARARRMAELRDRPWDGPGGVADESLPTQVRWTIAQGWNGFGREFMPPLDEGSFLFMPTTMAHASIGESLDILSKQDLAISSVPEVESVVGKLGRAESPLDPAPTSMFETVINYRSEYATDESGRILRFRYDADSDAFLRDERGELIPDLGGRPFRQWRDHVHSPRDIWDEIVAAAEMPGVTGAPLLQPIEARRVMLSTGMRSPMGVKITGPDLESIERAALQIERLLREVPGVAPETVIADRIVGKPYIEIDLNVNSREALSRYGLTPERVQNAIEVAIGGRPITMTVEGRERYPVRVRYQRELRDSIESLGRILVPTPDGAQIPLEQLADIRYVRGPQEIKSEDTFLVGYVLFDRQDGFAEVDVVESTRRHLRDREAAGEFVRPPGVELNFAGTYQESMQAAQTLWLAVPAALFVIFLIIYFQFRAVSTTLLVFLGIAVAWSGGLILIWLYGQPWFLDVNVFGVNLRDLFQVHPIHMSVAVWVGFLALFGIATDDGVVMGTYLEQSFRRREPDTVRGIREATLAAGLRRVRPCLMTTATTVIALLPVLTSTGRGSDIMVPMALASFGGMLIEIATMLIVPVLYAAVKEFRRHSGWGTGATGAAALATFATGLVPGVALMLGYNAVRRRGER